VQATSPHAWPLHAIILYTVEYAVTSLLRPLIFVTEQYTFSYKDTHAVNMATPLINTTKFFRPVLVRIFN
jgi:hypothetical protein